MIIETANKSAIEPVVHVKPPEVDVAPAQAMPLGDVAEAVTDSKDTSIEEKAWSFSQTVDLAVNIQNNLNTIHNVNMNFSVHEASDRVMVTITDDKTGDVIREIPSSEILNIAAKLNEMVGLLFDQKG